MRLHELIEKATKGSAIKASAPINKPRDGGNPGGMQKAAPAKANPLKGMQVPGGNNMQDYMKYSPRYRKSITSKNYK